ncbi:MAG: AAA family ATPase, partial [Anaerolineae bacterium]
MPDLLEIYSSYVPPLVLRRLAEEPTGKHAPFGERVLASMLFADISGFTRLADGLVRKGPEGAEELSLVLNQYFDQLIELVTSHGGEVVSFAGDALLALWPVAEGDQDLAAESRRAAQCGLAVQARLHGYETPSGDRLSLRIGVGAGEPFAATVGGERDRWAFFMAGPSLAEMGDAQRQARPGEVVVAPAVWASLPAGTFRGRALPAGGVRLEEVREPLALRPSTLAEPGAGALRTLRGYVPSAIWSRLEAGQSGWLAELRRLTVVFIRVRGVDYGAGTEEVLDQVHGVMHSLQTAVYRFDGSITRFSADDKGTILLAAFGLPPQTHEDDAARAVLAALEVQRTVRDLGLECAIGIATGQAFCGDIGGPTRREFTMIGDVVNLAARLQEVQADGVLTDQATAEAGRGLATLQKLPAFDLKGKAQPVVAYRPIPEPVEAARLSPIVGRENEVALLNGQLEALEAGKGGLVLVEGEAGIGKSRLVAELLKSARGRNVSVLTGAGEAIESSTPYHPWRSVLTQVFDMGGLREPEARRTKVLSRLEEEDPEALELAPLLNAVLALDLQATETTARMTDRADQTHELVVRVLQSATEERALLIALEDAHWLDSASWALTRLVALQVAPMLLVIVRRPMEESRESRQLREMEGTVTVQLGGLSEAQTKDLLENRLGIPNTSEGLASLVHGRSEGNPFFAEELIYAMRDQGLILVSEGECGIAPGRGDIAQLTPNTVQSVITSRLGRLTPAQQMTVKVASVIGPVFSLETLRDVYPIEPDRPELRGLLDDLQRLDIAMTATPEPNEAYAFRHAITQEVAYSQLPPSLRRKLHRSVAEWYETRDGEGETAYYPILAHHWTQAEDSSKAIAYLVKAGEQALLSFANEEAVKLLTEALTLDAQTEEEGDRLRRAGWEVQLGQAYVNWSRYGPGLSHLQRGLALLDRSVPGSSLSQVTGVVAQVIRQFVHRLRAAPSEEQAPEPRASLLAASRAYERVMEVAYFAAEDLLTAYAAFRGLNLAEVAGGDSPELARAYANVGAIVGFVPLRRFRGIADGYIHRAEMVLDRVDSLEAKSWVSLTVGTHYAGL